MKPTIDPKELNQIENYFLKDMPDFTKFTKGGDLLEALGDESMKWAAAFCQITKKKLDIDLPLMYVQGWFANAVERAVLVHKVKVEEAAKSPDRVELTPAQVYECSEYNHGEY